MSLTKIIFSPFRQDTMTDMVVDAEVEAGTIGINLSLLFFLSFSLSFPRALILRHAKFGTIGCESPKFLV